MDDTTEQRGGLAFGEAPASGRAPATHPGQPPSVELLLMEMRGEMRERFGRLEERQEAATERADERFARMQEQTDYRHRQNQQVLLSLTERTLACMPRPEAERAVRQLREDTRTETNELWSGIERHRLKVETDIGAIEHDVRTLSDLRSALLKVIAMCTAAGAIAGGAIEFTVKYAIQHKWWPFG